MNVVIAWIIVGAVVAALSCIPPATMSYGDYWGEWWRWNLFIWGVLIGALMLSAALTWSVLQLIGMG